MWSALKRCGPASARSSLHPLARARKRQGDIEHRAAAQLTLRPHLAAVQLDDLPDDRQAETGAGDVLGRLRVDARKALEDRLQRLWRDPETFVAHLDPHPLSVGTALHTDPPTGR